MLLCAAWFPGPVIHGRQAHSGARWPPLRGLRESSATGLSWRPASAHRLVHSQASPVLSAPSCRAWSHSAGAQWLQTTAGDQEGRLPATSKCCCFLRLKCSLPKVPLSAKQKQSPTGTRPCHRGTKMSQFSVFQRPSAVSGTHSPVGEQMVMWSPSLRTRSALSGPFVSGGRPLVAWQRMRLILPWCQLPGGRLLVSHPAGSEQGDEVKVSGPRSPLRWAGTGGLLLALPQAGQVPAF